MICDAANSRTFEPLTLADPAFMAWALHVGIRLRNMPPGSPDGEIKHAILKDGIPSPEWAQGLAFMMRLAQANKRESASV